MELVLTREFEVNKLVEMGYSGIWIAAMSHTTSAYHIITPRVLPAGTQHRVGPSPATTTERDLPYVLSLPPPATSNGTRGSVGLVLHLHGAASRGLTAAQFMEKDTLLWALGGGWEQSPWHGSNLAVVSPISPRERGLEWRTPWLRHAVMALVASVLADIGLDPASDRVAVIGHR